MAISPVTQPVRTHNADALTDGMPVSSNISHDDSVPTQVLESLDLLADLLKDPTGSGVMELAKLAGQVGVASTQQALHATTVQALASNERRLIAKV